MDEEKQVHPRLLTSSSSFMSLILKDLSLSSSSCKLPTSWTRHPSTL